jgi:hypothetical protein
MVTGDHGGDGTEGSHSQPAGETNNPAAASESPPVELYRRSVLGAAAGVGALFAGGAASVAGAPGRGPDDEGGGPPGRERKEVELSFLGRYSSGVFDEGAAEIVDYDPDTERLFVVNGAASVRRRGFPRQDRRARPLFVSRCSGFSAYSRTRSVAPVGGTGVNVFVF